MAAGLRGFSVTMAAGLRGFSGTMAAGLRGFSGTMAAGLRGFSGTMTAGLRGLAGTMAAGLRGFLRNHGRIRGDCSGTEAGIGHLQFRKLAAIAPIPFWIDGRRSGYLWA